jgi:hypothetical protein
MVRVSIYLSIPQQRAIARKAKIEGVSVSEAIRDLIVDGTQCDFDKMSPAEQRIENNAAWLDHSSDADGA